MSGKLLIFSAPSGAGKTTIVKHLIEQNFNATVTWEFGWKHFFGFNNFSSTDDTLFIAIVRDPVEWFNSFYKQPHHLAPHLIPKQIPPQLIF
jgi:nicotinamide riboside kinase